MKIIWSLPTFNNPQTGGEKAFERLADLLKANRAFIIHTYHENRTRAGVLRKIYINFRNFKILTGYDKQAPIFQDLSNRPNYFLANALLHSLLKRRIIVFVHETYEIYHIPFMQRWIRQLVNYIYFCSTALIVVNSQSTGDWVCSFGNFRRKLFMMYPVIHQKTGKLEIPKRSENSPVNIVCVGNIRNNKGQIYLLEALEYIKKDVEITLVGLIKEEDYVERLRTYVAEKGIGNKVHFKGFLNDSELMAEYQRADIFVSPTLKEGFGMSVFEAMSFGLPVVASGVGGISEQLTDGKEGFLVKPGDPITLANKIDKFITNPELRSRMGALARDRAASLPNLDQAFEQFYEVVRSLCLRK